MNWRARPLVSYRVIVDLISATATETALAARYELDTNTYPKGLIVTDQKVVRFNIVRDRFRGEWNDTIQNRSTADGAVNS